MVELRDGCPMNGCCQRELVISFLIYFYMNPSVSPVDRHFVPDLCRCADLERSLIMIKDDMVKEDVVIPRLRGIYDIKPLHPRDMFEFENMLDSVVKDVKDMTANHSNLIKLMSETREIYYVLNHLDPILGDVEAGYTKFPKTMRVGAGTGAYDRRQLKIITGVIDRSLTYHFQTMLWRISHGTIYYKDAARDEKFQNLATGRDVRKVAFVIVCPGEELQQRILKVCNGFNVNLYRWPETHEDRVSTINELAKRMVEMDKVLQRTKVQRMATFRTIAQQWENWLTQVRKAKAIYYQLNLFNFDISSNTLIGQCWLADRNFNKVESALEISSASSSARSFIVRTYTEATPPTSYRTNRFTEGFQNVTCSYDYGRYRELNPAIFSVILFPFLFGVMCGDVGHGLLIFIYGIWMINNEKKYASRRSRNDVWNIIFAGRYMILLMGLFTIFMGFMYNEWFSQAIKLMAAYWLNTSDPNTISKSSFITLNPKADTGFVYLFGIDPGIKIAANGLSHENSVKMKLAVIIGLSHMTLGLILNICNIIYFRKFYAILCHSVPRLLFIWCIYGWLVYMFFYKWILSFYTKQMDFRAYWPTLSAEFLDLIFWRNISLDCWPRITQAVANNPNLLPAMTLFARDLSDRMETKVILYHVALLCFPIMAFASPIYLYTRHMMSVRRLENSGEYGECQIDAFKKQQGVDFKTLLTHRLVRTMEYGLATVSHMASYLRLWAISVAHTVMARLLWHSTMRTLALRDLTPAGSRKIVLVFPIWATATVFFLVLMDGIAMFIHVLRLQWIEFMSKFFKGGGIPFVPFSLATILDDLDFRHCDEETEALCKQRRVRASAGDF
ncbi:V-type proton ATPase 116 kDa subunit a 4-like isoform X2 [Plodia interpunctella]|uniref:V-type proton ATPase 116 kDa subunit a 4-like isoform X2 n=1 Tax=Plodia interpunctella TaxID=58824 RepID=UPI002367F06D|nr:V-type proton ATPase 116 kDa subunit a 4-like isoform X2 [Plodia interpunctella]